MLQYFLDNRLNCLRDFVRRAAEGSTVETLLTFEIYFGATPTERPPRIIDA